MFTIKKANNPEQHPIINEYAAPAAKENLYQLAFDNSLHANLITTIKTGKIEIANDAACKLLGHTKKELLKKNRSEIFNINERSLKRMLKRRAAEGHSGALVSIIKKSGKYVPCEITSSVFLDEFGLKKAITTIIDISKSILKQKVIDFKKEKIVNANIVIAKSKQKTLDIKKEKIAANNIKHLKRKQIKIDNEREKVVSDNIVLALAKSEARLAENNEWIKHIAKTSYDVMWAWDLVSGEIYVGDSIEDVFGYKVHHNTIRFHDFSSCLLKSEKTLVKKNLSRVLASGKKSYTASFMFKRHDGSVASTVSRASIVRNEKGKTIRMIGAIQDVTRMQELEKKLEDQISLQEEHGEQFFLSVKLSFDVIWDWNMRDELIIGDGFEELFGYPVKNNHCTLDDWLNHIHPDDKATVKMDLYAAIASSSPCWEEHTYRYIRADNSVANILGRATIFRNAEGKAYRMLGVLQDITERKKKDIEKESIIKELLKSNADLKQFSYITSHNLRAPLSNMQGILNLIDYSTLQGGNAAMLKMLNTSVKQLTKTIDDLTNILFLKSNVSAKISTINLPEAFAKAADIFKLLLQETGAKVSSAFEGTCIDFNETYFESILINLFSNAIKYRSQERTLIIHASCKNDKYGNIVFTFADNGSGIDINRYKDRLFGLYQRFHDNMEGQGLGLYIIKSQIEALQGKIEVKSEVNNGTAFIITFKKQQPASKAPKMFFPSFPR